MAWPQVEINHHTGGRALYVERQRGAVVNPIDGELDRTSWRSQAAAARTDRHGHFYGCSVNDRVAIRRDHQRSRRRVNHLHLGRSAAAGKPIGADQVSGREGMRTNQWV